MSRATWNQPEIERWEALNAPTERSFIGLLDDNAPPGWGAADRRGTKYARHDCIIIAHVIGWWPIELECGTTQTDWDDVLLSPQRWPRGLSMLSRKYYQNLAFIRYSPTYRSAYAVSDAWFRQAVLTGVIGPPAHVLKNKTQEAFGGGDVDLTDNQLYGIQWDVVEWARDVGYLFVMEHEDWRGLWEFLVGLTGLEGLW